MKSSIQFQQRRNIVSNFHQTFHPFLAIPNPPKSKSYKSNKHFQSETLIERHTTIKKNKKLEMEGFKRNIVLKEIVQSYFVEDERRCNLVLERCNLLQLASVQWKGIMNLFWPHQTA